MKTLIIGKRGIGVTYFIKNTLLPQTEKALIFDLNEEYKKYNSPRAIFKGYRVLPMKFKINEMNEKVMGMIALTSTDETIILDSFKSYLSPKRDMNNKISYGWLNDILKNKKAVLTLQSVADVSVENIGINMDDVEKIYLFDTIDNEKLIKHFTNKYQNIIEQVPIFARNGA